MKVVNIKVNGQTYKAIFKDSSLRELADNQKNEASFVEDVADGWGIWFPYKGETSKYQTDRCENGFSLFVGLEVSEDGERTTKKQYAQVWDDEVVVDDF